MKILVTGLVPKKGILELYKYFTVIYNDKIPFSNNQIYEYLPEIDGVLLMGEKADKEFIDRSKKLKIIAVNGVGYDNVNINYAREKNILVCNSPQSVLEPTAELTMGLILTLTRRISYYDRNLRAGIWKNVSDEKEMGFTLQGATLGIVGMGRIGKSVAKKAYAFGMKVIYSDYNPVSDGIPHEINAEKVDFNVLLEKSDIITIHTPLSPNTFHLFDEEQFKTMKKSAFIINAARGPIINEKTLVQALKNETIAGAALDVFEFEPNINNELLQMENVVLTPHAGTGCLSSRINIAFESSNNLISYLINNNPINVVN